MRPPAVRDLGWIRVEDPSAIGTARRAAGAAARSLGFSEDRVAEVGLAVTELATNTVVHASAGALLLRVRRHTDDSGLEMVLVDSGPGMDDVGAAMRDGMSTAGTLGIGLGAVRRLANRLDIHSDPRRGSIAVATFRRDRAVQDQWPVVDGMTRPIVGEEVCGDAWAALRSGDLLVVVLSDGLGHGALAADASRLVLDRFDTEPWRGPAAFLQSAHAALGGSRGAAVSVIELDLAARTLVFAGIGNVTGRLVSGARSTGLAPQPGIVGHHMRDVRPVTHRVTAHDLVVLHSDGLSQKWDLEGHRGAASRPCDLVAALLLREAGLRQDDAAVVVTRVP